MEMSRCWLSLRNLISNHLKYIHKITESFSAVPYFLPRFKGFTTHDYDKTTQKKGFTVEKERYKIILCGCHQGASWKIILFEIKGISFSGIGFDRDR